MTTEAPDNAVYEAAKARWDSLSKPIDGLGDFETLVCRIAAMQGTIKPKITKRAAVVFCADNGIVCEGVSQCGSEVTLSVADAIGKGISSACTIAKSVHADVIGVDIGIDGKTPDNLINAKVTAGTKDFLKESAMTEAEMFRAIETGMEIAGKMTEEGYDILLTGEMGIGNTTTSSAVLIALLQNFRQENADSLIKKIVGRGAGLSDEGFMRKKAVIKEALHKYRFEVNASWCTTSEKQNSEDTTSKETAHKALTLRILQTLGGPDIAALAGFFIGAAKMRKPVVIDGLISATAALIAKILVPGCEAYMIASHAGRETGTRMALSAIGLTPMILGNMALGEGTGALMMLGLIDTAVDFYENAAKFEQINVDAYTRF